MNPEDLEQRLMRIPLAGPPSGWREEILTAARAARNPAPVEADLASLVRPAGDRTEAALGSVRGGRRWWNALGDLHRWFSSPLAPLGAALLLVAGLDRAVAWAESSRVGESARRAMTSSSGVAVLSAARSYCAEVAAWTRPEDDAPSSEADVAHPRGGGRGSRSPDQRPRTEWVPGRGPGRASLPWGLA